MCLIERNSGEHSSKLQFISIRITKRCIVVTLRNVYLYLAE